MFAAYNAWANQRVYDAAAELDEAELLRDTGAFFRSMMGTLNHITGRRPHLDEALHRRG